PGFLNTPDIFGAGSTQYIVSTPHIQMASTAVAGVPQWGAWQDFVPGTYQGQYFNLRIIIRTTNPQVTAFITGFSYTVNRGTRVDYYQDLTIPAAGKTIVFTPSGATAP